jgi:hypothetical protein
LISQFNGSMSIIVDCYFFIDNLLKKDDFKITIQQKEICITRIIQSAFRLSDSEVTIRTMLNEMEAQILTADDLRICHSEGVEFWIDIRVIAWMNKISSLSTIITSYQKIFHSPIVHTLRKHLETVQALEKWEKEMRLSLSYQLFDTTRECVQKSLDHKLESNLIIEGWDGAHAQNNLSFIQYGIQKLSEQIYEKKV